MALTLTTTVGSASANAYNSLAELQAEADVQLPTPLAWEHAQDDDRSRAAVLATRILDRLPWVGERVDATQALEHPRIGLPESDLADIPTTEIAAGVKRAHAALTFHLLAEVDAGRDPQAGAEDAGVSSIRFGDELALTFESGATSVTPLERFIRQVIRPMLRGLVYADQPGASRR